MKEVWANIKFSPTIFELPEDTNEDEDREDTMDGDRPVKKIPEVEKQDMSEATKERPTGLQISNIPKEITEEGVISFLKKKCEERS